MKNRRKMPVALLLAALVVVIAGGAFAAGKLGVFDRMGGIEPLPGAENLVADDLGSAENDRASFTVEQAVFDGQGAIVCVRIASKQPEQSLPFCAFLQDAPEEEYLVESVPVEVDGNQTVIIDGVETALPTYEKDGVTYYKDQFDFRVLGRKDGRTLIGYWPSLTVDGTGEAFEIQDAEAQPDGSVLVWAELRLEDVAESLNVTACPNLTDETGAEIPIDPVSFRLERDSAVTTARISPSSGGQAEILSGEIRFTPVKGYLTVTFRTEGIDPLRVYVTILDGSGDPIPMGGGWCEVLPGEDGTARLTDEIQTVETLPDSLIFQFEDEDGVEIGRVPCAVRGED